MSYWLTTVAVILLALVVVTAISRHVPPPADDGIRPIYFGRCGGIEYKWHYDPRTVMSGRDCIVDRIER